MPAWPVVPAYTRMRIAGSLLVAASAVLAAALDLLPVYAMLVLAFMLAIVYPWMLVHEARATRVEVDGDVLVVHHANWSQVIPLADFDAVEIRTGPLARRLGCVDLRFHGDGQVSAWLKGLPLEVAWHLESRDSTSDG